MAWAGAATLRFGDGGPELRHDVFQALADEVAGTANTWHGLDLPQVCTVEQFAAAVEDSAWSAQLELLAVDLPAFVLASALGRLIGAISERHTDLPSLKTLVVHGADLDTLGDEVLQVLAPQVAAIELELILFDDDSLLVVRPDEVARSTPPAKPANAYEDDRPIRSMTIADLRLVFDHFEFTQLGETYHTNVVALAEEIPTDARRWLEHSVGIDAPLQSVGYVGEATALLSHCASLLCGGDASVVLDIEEIRSLARPHARATPTPAPPAPELILTDIVASEEEAARLRVSLSRIGWSDVPVFALAAAPSSTVRSALPLSGVVFRTRAWKCRYCDTAVPLHAGPATLLSGEMTREVFWDMCAWDADQIISEHWISDRGTKYHFNLRVRTDHLFERFSYGLSFRVREQLRGSGILPGWIDGIICTDGYESAHFVPEIARRLNIPASQIVEVKRRTVINRMVASARDSAEIATEWLADQPNYSAWRATLRNVLVVDQAAHHFRTLNELQVVASILGARALAFTVLLDVSDHEVNEVAGLHYQCLYRWPCPPVRGGSCSCHR